MFAMSAVDGQSDVENGEMKYLHYLQNIFPAMTMMPPCILLLTRLLGLSFHIGDAKL
jgi:hypothetical protein